jgi:hypothetical protein
MYDHLPLAHEILPLFRANSLRGLTRTCGYYAFRSGRDPKAVGYALHLIGAACVLARAPVAPIRFVEQLEEEWRGIFSIAAADSVHAEAWPAVCAASRLHAYSESDFNHVASVFPQVSVYAQAGETPLGLWRVVVDHAFAPAALRYAQILALAEARQAETVWQRAPVYANPYAIRSIPLARNESLQ